MPRKPKATNKKKGREDQHKKSVNREVDNSTRVGNVRENIGVAIGTNAKSTVIQVGSLFDLGNLQTLVKNHRGFLALSTLTQFSAFAAWASFKDRFLIPTWLLATGMILIEIFLVSFYVLKSSQPQKNVYSTVGVLSLIALIGLTGMEYKRVIYPPKFTRGDFGVAIAHFGEGPDFENTPQAKEVTQLILDRLTQQGEENPDLSFVKFKPVGLIRTKEEAVIEGKRIDADLVIWGQLQISEQATTLNFEILDTPGEVSNPTFQRAAPLLEKPSRGMLVIPSKDSEEIADATTTISGFTFGLAHYFKWDFASAALAFQEALETSPSHSDDYLYLLHLYYGLSLQWPGEYEFANEQFRLASSYHPEDPAAPLSMAFGHRYLINNDEAQRNAEIAYKLTNQYIGLHPDSPLAYFDRAIANVIFKDWESALKDYQRAIQIDPNLYSAYIGVIRMNLELERPQEAKQAALEAISVAEANGVNPAWAYMYLGESSALTGDKTQALLAYQKATTLMPEVDYIHFRAGQYYAEEGKLEDAEAEFRSMIEVTSNKSWAHSSFAIFYADKGKYIESIEQYQFALLANPKSSDNWVALADLYATIGKLNEALDAYERGVATSSSTSEMIFSEFSFGNFFYRIGNWLEAISHWQLALELDPQQCDLLLNIGSAYENLENFEEASTVYAIAVTIIDVKQLDCTAEAQRNLERISP